MPQPVDDDSTIKLKPPLPLRKSRLHASPWSSLESIRLGTIRLGRLRLGTIRLSTIALPALLVLVLGAGGWEAWKWSRPSEPEAVAPSALRSLRPPANGPEIPEQPQTAPSPDAASVPAPVGEPPVAHPAPERAAAMPPMPRRDFRIETASEQGVLNHVETEGSEGLTVFRLRQNSRILVLDFASLRDQGRMLNRAAALVEKYGLPHDRLLNDTELDEAIRSGGDTVETFYYGHDYGTSSLVRFFQLAEHGNIPLSVQEETLRNLIREEGWFEPNARSGLISIPRVGADEYVTRRARATILHHELSHGEYFTNPAYAAFVHKFWNHTLTEAERQQVRDHLRSLGYDPSLDEVMENEAQAYLMFTDSPDFFTPEMFGMTKGRVNELRNGFYRTMPAGWLRDSLGQTLNANRTISPHP